MSNFMRLTLFACLLLAACAARPTDPAAVPPVAVPAEPLPPVVDTPEPEVEPAPMPTKVVPPRRVGWHTDYMEARAEATRFGLPLLVYLRTSPCFWCDKMEAGTLRSTSGQAAIAGVVAVKLDAAKAPLVVEAVGARGYPFFALAQADGTILRTRAGHLNAVELGAFLYRATAFRSEPGCRCAHGGTQCPCGGACMCDPFWWVDETDWIETVKAPAAPAACPACNVNVRPMPRGLFRR